MLFRPADRQSPLAGRLAAFGFIRLLSERARQKLESECTPLELPAGAALLSAGDDCSALLLVERGGIRVYKQAENGREITLYQVRPGESCVLGTSCILQTASYPAEAVVDAATDALAVPAHLFRELFHSEDAARQFVMELFTLRLSGMMLLVEEVAFRRMDQRLARFLLDEAQLQPGLLRPVTLSHEQIAARLGTAREVVSRLLQNFAAEGEIELERRQIRLQDIESLRARLVAE